MRKLILFLCFIALHISLVGQERYIPIELNYCTQRSFSFTPGDEWYRLHQSVLDTAVLTNIERFNIIDSNKISINNQFFFTTNCELKRELQNYIENDNLWKVSQKDIEQMYTKDTALNFNKSDITVKLLNIGKQSHILLKQTDSILILANPKDIVTTKKGLMFFKYSTYVTKRAWHLLTEKAEKAILPIYNMQTKRCSADTLNYNIGDWIKEHIIFPPQYQGNIISGRMVIKLSFNKDGFVRNVEILNPLDEYLNDYVVKKIATMPSVKNFQITSKDKKIGGLLNMIRKVTNFEDIVVELEQPVEVLLEK